MDNNKNILIFWITSSNYSENLSNLSLENNMIYTVIKPVPKQI
jgi:hypothetical protein